jgi:uncharacterized protein
MDVSPVVPSDRQVIDSYGGRSFRISGIVFEGAVLVRPDGTETWAARSMAEVTAAVLAPLLAGRGIELLLLGCGARMLPVPSELRRALRQAGIVIEAMDTGAACRTYNILMAEDRRVAAALLPIG